MLLRLARPLCALVFFACFLLPEPAAVAADITGGSGVLTVSVDPAGSYEIVAADQAWHFNGSTGVPLSNVLVSSGNDGIGFYSEISFNLHTDALRHAGIRAYRDRAVVLFSVTCLNAAPNTFNFPNWTTYPRTLDHLTFSGIFAPPTFSGFAPESPWIFFDSHANTFILSPASNFMTATSNYGPNFELNSGISPQITNLPNGFQHRTMLVVEKGINRAFNTWGNALTTLQGKIRPANDADATLQKIGYWTDRGSPYYYKTEPNMTYEQTLKAIKGDFDRVGIGLGHVQLDSWFYPKGPNANWIDNGSGIYQYSAASPLFPDGLKKFQQDLGVALVTHSRWIDPTSPYRVQYQMSGNVVTDPLFWSQVADYLANSGVSTYEQDWLGDKARTDFNLTDGDAFLDNMASAMARRNLTIQYCMPTARHFLQSSKYSNLTTARASDDRLDGIYWTSFLYSSRLASAVGVWPFTDNFLSTETNNLLLATLSAGPIGIGDPVGTLNASNLLRAVRRDGVIVKPDVPLTPIDASYANAAHGVDAPQVASTFTDLGPMKTLYVFSYATGANKQIKLKASELGVDRHAFLYDYFGGTGRKIGPGTQLNTPITGDLAYWVIAPIGPSGIAILGDLDQFVSMGHQRISSFMDDGKVHMTIAFAKGENSRVITGYSPEPPQVSVGSGLVEGVKYDNVTHQFRILLTPLNNVASITIGHAIRAASAAGR